MKIKQLFFAFKEKNCIIVKRFGVVFKSTMTSINNYPQPLFWYIAINVNDEL